MPLKSLYGEALFDPKPVASWWEASAPPPQAGYEPLTRDETVEVAIIGAGYTGLSCAYHLAKDHGIEALVLDAGHIGWGASGRNGGFVCFPAGKLGLQAMIQRYGLEEARRYIQSQVDAVDLVDRLGREENIDYDRQGNGFWDVAHRPRAFDELKDYGRALTDLFGVPTRTYNAEAFAAIGHKGTENHGALLIQHGFGLHPLKFLAGLAAAAKRRGARLHGHSPVTALTKEGEWHLLTTPGGRVRARRVVIACNGFLKEGLHPALDGRLLPALSNIIVTRPLTAAEQAEENFITQSPLSNTRRLLFYYRLLPDRRILFGARGDTEGSQEAADRMRLWLIRRLREVFPGFREVEVTHFWRGLVSLTRRLTPAVGRLPDDPTVFFAYGCHGNGVNTMPWAGQTIARLIRGANRDEDLLPAVVRGLSPRFPLPALRRWYLKGAYALYQMKDG